jgi:hypothetical protein
MHSSAFLSQNGHNSRMGMPAGKDGTQAVQAGWPCSRYIDLVNRSFQIGASKQQGWQVSEHTQMHSMLQGTTTWLLAGLLTGSGQTLHAQPAWQYVPSPCPRCDPAPRESARWGRCGATSHPRSSCRCQDRYTVRYNIISIDSCSMQPGRRHYVCAGCCAGYMWNGLTVQCAAVMWYACSRACCPPIPHVCQLH